MSEVKNIESVYVPALFPKEGSLLSDRQKFSQHCASGSERKALGTAFSVPNLIVTKEQGMNYLKGSAIYQWIGGCLLVLLAGCSMGESKYLAGDVNGVNHTSAAINHFSVNGYGGPNISPHGYGGGMCCAMLPRQWQPGLKMINGR